MTGDGIPSSACTRRPDEIGADGFSSSRLAGNNFPASGCGGGGERRRRRGVRVKKRGGRGYDARVRVNCVVLSRVWSRGRFLGVLVAAGCGIGFVQRVKSNILWETFQSRKKGRPITRKRRRKGLSKSKNGEIHGGLREQECVGCSDSEASSSETSSSRESEDEVHCLIADDIEEVFVFSSPEFTHEDLVNALNEMVLDNKKLSQSLEEVKCERESCATSVELVSSINMQAALSKLETENEKLRSRSKEILCENQRLAGINVATKPSGDRTGLGHNSDEGSTAETSSTSRLERTKFKTMNFVKSSSEHPEEAHSDELRKTAEPTI
ncbi:hypothetical protein F511_41720 [Dorcoceras hygrometricum]|uniref:Uncharacterized protein n=1 Tax=Dorcoceras hygrometricum TaxID=472368 RepID=A0A2Z7CL07_9LAMI|nr:hypothetical protein F511_41720 [Dorcoceras hygrometricum]